MFWLAQVTLKGWDQTRKSVLSSRYDIICNHSQVPLYTHLLMEVGDFSQVRRGPCLPDEIMTLWLLRMWIADDMETIVEWQTTVTREMGDVGQTWKWGPRAKSYYVVSLYWDPHTYMWTSNQNLNRAYFCCPCKVCFGFGEGIHWTDYHFILSRQPHVCMGHGTTPKIVLALAMFWEWYEVVAKNVLRLGMMCWQSVTGWQMLMMTIGSIMVS